MARAKVFYFILADDLLFAPNKKKLWLRYLISFSTFCQLYKQAGNKYLVSSQYYFVLIYKVGRQVPTIYLKFYIISSEALSLENNLIWCILHLIIKNLFTIQTTIVILTYIRLLFSTTEQIKINILYFYLIRKCLKSPRSGARNSLISSSDLLTELLVSL